jgi:hypothetical protein
MNSTTLSFSGDRVYDLPPITLYPGDHFPKALVCIAAVTNRAVAVVALLGHADLDAGLIEDRLDGSVADLLLNHVDGDSKALRNGVILTIFGGYDVVFG